MLQRITSQQKIIFDCLKRQKSHPTAQELYEILKKEGYNIGIATVYRNLNKLSLNGSIMRITIKDEEHFDGDLSNHYHLNCKKCGKIIDVYDDKMMHYLKQKIKNTSFDIDSYQFIMEGTCLDCK